MEAVLCVRSSEQARTTTNTKEIEGMNSTQQSSPVRDSSNRNSNTNTMEVTTMKSSKSMNPAKSMFLALFTILFVTASAVTSHGAVIASYDFSPIGSITSDDAEANSTAGNYTVKLGSMSSASNTHFITENLFPGANTLTEVATFNVTADSGYKLNLSSLDFSYAGEEQIAGSTYRYTVFSSADSYATAIYNDPVQSSGTWVKSANIALTDSMFQDLSDITFSIRLATSSTASGTSRLRIISTQSTGSFTGATDLVLNGEMVIPEPSTVALLLLGSAGLLLRRRHRRA